MSTLRPKSNCGGRRKAGQFFPHLASQVVGGLHLRIELRAVQDFLIMSGFLFFSFRVSINQFIICSCCSKLN